MENKVYYGEYSLKHWIDLILKENIILPAYQRSFVWKEASLKALISALKEKQFVPPITIGAFTIEGKPQNLIIDGQQRLTSILLAYLNKFPDRDKYKNQVEEYANEDDDEEGVFEKPDIIDWTFRTYLEEEKNNKAGHYHTIEKLDNIDDDFLNNTFLGFSYLVSSNPKAQQKYFSTTFRSINSKGIGLSPQESRAALYFLDKDLEDFFNTDVCKAFKVNNGAVDFVRYLALLSQYKNVNGWVADGYSRKMESYYEEYIYSVVGDTDSIFGKFSTIFPNKNYQKRFESLRQTLKELEFSQKFSSIIDLDVYFFGLIYEIVFENKEIKLDDKVALKKELETKSKEFKDIPLHWRAPKALKYLNPRIAASIEIYRKYVKE
jgi:uncharacterized protein with ParB-like and HNH nuclease domain